MITHKELTENFYYDFDTGELYRIVKSKLGCMRKVGYIQSKGYLQLTFKKKQYLVHRLIWMYVHGDMPVNQIDHKNRDKTDNRIENLRDVTNSENHKNIGVVSSNTSGVTGVCWHKTKEKWIARITVDSVTKNLGSFDSKSQAVTARKNAERYYGFMSEFS